MVNNFTVGETVVMAKSFMGAAVGTEATVERTMPKDSTNCAIAFVRFASREGWWVPMHVLAPTMTTVSRRRHAAAQTQFQGARGRML